MHIPFPTPSKQDAWRDFSTRPSGSARNGMRIGMRKKPAGIGESDAAGG